MRHLKVVSDIVWERIHGKRFFASNNRTVGLWLSHIEASDLVCVLSGCSYPVVLHQQGEHFRFMGEVYMEGILLGEAMEWQAGERVCVNSSSSDKQS